MSKDRSGKKKNIALKITLKIPENKIYYIRLKVFKSEYLLRMSRNRRGKQKKTLKISIKIAKKI